MATASLPRRIALFPLPNVVLFPSVFLPLHIFEPRYRQMVADALDGDRLIGMVLLRSGEAGRGSPNPPVFPVGCAGRITHVAALPDGRYNIVLRGVERFRIEDEDRSRAYRIAAIDALPESPVDDGCEERLRAGRRRLEAMLGRLKAGAESRIPPGMTDAELINVLSQCLEFEPIERQALLEKDDPCARCATLIDLLEMRRLSAGRPLPGVGVQ